ncbi:hypothetical protein PHYBOEH_008255 [Phytophthora boehmeriae]|uniref:RxLR effector protein n=1 Tax=Phytophthora boehmeriae TaxID=109152 RepID=A0A8T1W0L8_9STRA|nr:hypothetical protein PHYBOEH_008255 [Phytophthora boehmeriae]
MRAIFILPVAVATLLLASDVTAGGIQGLGHMKIDKVVMGGPVQSEAAQASALRQRFLRSHEETDADNEERVLNKSLMLRNEDHKMFIFQKWYDAGKSSMWAYDKLKIGTGEKYEKYRDLYNEYARFRLARNK